MNQSEFSKHLQEFERQVEKDLKYLLKKRRIEEKIRGSSGFLHFIFNLQKEIFEFQHPFHTSILGFPGSGKMIRGCSMCGKLQEDGVEIFDYYHIGEGVFCIECRKPDTDLKEQVQSDKEELVKEQK
ncbi:hypothetical protein ACMSE3_25900 [Bacteroides thetaiotaomicron]|uniref:hypothetical protein n=1 Tax=Bacteroides thetaiotaomicron TaxID=818 RepID=UPI0039C341E1